MQCTFTADRGTPWGEPAIVFNNLTGRGRRGAPSGPRPAQPQRPRVSRPKLTMSPSTKRSLIAAAVILVLIVLLFATASFWVTWWWFGSIGYRSVLVRRYTGEASVFIVALLVAGAFFYVNAIVALRRSRQATTSRTGRFTTYTDRFVLLLAALAGAVIAVIVALAAAANWERWLLWWYGDAYGLKDPVFQRDVSFYLFTLPVLQQTIDLLLLLTIVTIAGVVVVYTLRLGVDLRQLRNAPQLLRVHVFSLAGFLLLVLAVRHYLANYQLVYSQRGAAFGASYTDVQAQRPANWALAVVALVIGGLLVANGFVQRVRWLVGAAGVYVALFLVLGVVVPAAVQQTVVEPSELKRERPYIANNIAMTQAAVVLDGVDQRELTGQATLTTGDLSTNPSTIANVRLWDYRVIRGTYQQLQSFVPYYVFLDVDVDRYIQDGELQQVVLSARELDQSGLPANAQTWTNERLVYTHGYGAVVSQVSSVSTQGLPTFLVERIPPTGQGAYRIDRPEIYFGEADLGWVVVNTAQPEFSGLIDTADPTSGAGYAGKGAGSIKLGNYLKKVLLAADLGDRNLLLSGNLTGDSRVLLNRNIVDRVATVAPFLELDADPYLVLADGRLVWVIDAYTKSDLFPHATREGGINYLRNSVKVTVDAYDGTVTFYRTGVPDPIADAYGDIYGDLFTPIAEAPASIAAHFRYPERLFELQSDVFASYHVSDPTAFYNGEDRWDIPQEQVEGNPQRMVPYYVTMTLPGESSAEFALIRPFIPGGRSQRQNMTSWMAGRLGPDGTTSLVVYRFPRQETIFGPSQIEARINQEPEISAQITLWSQSGSNVLRGNLLVIPIGESVLYVQPLYLQAANSTGALPELKRVIVATNERVVMSETLQGALAEITGAEVANVPTVDGSTPANPAPGAIGDQRVQTLVQQAVDAYTRGQQALTAGDWSAYGQAQADLQAALDQLATLSGTAPTTAPAGAPAATPIAGE